MMNSDDDFDDIICSSANEYIQKLSLGNKIWWQESEDLTKCSWIFRGQPDSQYELIPSLYRKNGKAREYVRTLNLINDKLSCTKIYISNRVKCHIKDKRKQILLNEVLYARLVEIYLTENFLNECNKNRLYVPTLKLFREQYHEAKSFDYFWDNIDKYIKKFKELLFIAPPYYNEILENDYPEAIALARHHGIPTRYLDWTSDPLVAAYFSLNTTRNHTKDKEICVWAINTAYLESSIFNRNRIRLHKKLLHTGLEYLHLQKGLFTEMVGYEGYYFQHQKWPSMLDYIKAQESNPQNSFSQYGQYIKRIRIDSKHSEEIRKILGRMGYNHSSLMPSYDNISLSIKKDII